MAGNLKEYDMPSAISRRTNKLDLQQSLYEKYQFEKIEALSKKERKRFNDLLEKKKTRGGTLPDDDANELRRLDEKDQQAIPASEGTRRDLFREEEEEEERRTEKKRQRESEEKRRQQQKKEEAEDILWKRGEKEETRGHVPVKKQTVQPIARLENDVEQIARSGMQYLYQFIGMFAAHLGDRDVRRYYKYKSKDSQVIDLQNPIVRGAKSLEDFVQLNSHLGRDFLEQVIMLTADESLLHPAVASSSSSSSSSLMYKKDKTINQVDEAEEIGINIIPPTSSGIPNANDDFLASIINNHTWAPGAVPSLQSDWAWSVMDHAVFSFILNETSLGAMGLALAMLNRIDRHTSCTLKKILMSPTVVDQFALLCSYQFLLASGGSAYAGTSIVDRGSVKGARLMLSTGIQTRLLLNKQVEGAQIWFQIHVFDSKNPRVAEMEKIVDELQTKINVDDQFNGGQLEFRQGIKRIGIPEGNSTIVEYVKRSIHQNTPFYNGFRNVFFFVPQIKEKSLLELRAIKNANQLDGVTLTNNESARVDDYIKLTLMKKQQSQILSVILVYHR